MIGIIEKIENRFNRANKPKNIKCLKQIKAESGFLTLEICFLTVMILVAAGLLLNLARVYKSHLLDDQRLTAIYLAEGQLDLREAQWEQKKLALRAKEGEVKLKGIDYIVSYEVKPLKQGLARIKVKVRWNYEHKTYALDKSREIFSPPARLHIN